MSVLLGIATTLGCFLLAIIGIGFIWCIWELFKYLVLGFIWCIWELFRDLVLGFEKTRIRVLENELDKYKPYLDQLKKETDKKIQKGKLK